MLGLPNITHHPVYISTVHLFRFQEIFILCYYYLNSQTLHIDTVRPSGIQG